MPVPDLPGCVADGESIEAAIAEAHDAFRRGQQPNSSECKFPPYKDRADYLARVPRPGKSSWRRLRSGGATCCLSRRGSRSMMGLLRRSQTSVLTPTRFTVRPVVPGSIGHPFVYRRSA